MVEATPRLRLRLNALLDALAQPRFSAGSRTVSTFQVCGAAGLVLALLLATLLARHAHLPLGVLAALLAAAAAVFLTLAMITKILIGSERLTYYHHEIAVLACAALLLRQLGQPLLPWLDITALAVGAFLACGRVGCFVAGCCHGRPHTWGVTYRREHAGEGFPRCLVGVRLLPVQLLEAAAVLSIVLAGAAGILSGWRPGEGLAWYAVAYSLVRFAMELLRGDGGRPSWRGVSEAQWTSLLMVGLVALAESAGMLPRHAWHFGAGVLLAGSLGLILATGGIRRRLFDARHVCQIAESLAAARSRRAVSGEIVMSGTSLGLHISASVVLQANRPVNLYAFSGPEGVLSDELAGRLARLISRLAHDGESVDLRKGSSGVYHVIVPEEVNAHVV